MNYKYIVVTQLSGYFVFSFFRKILLSNRCEKIYVLQQTKQRKYLFFDIYKVFGLLGILKIFFYEAIYLLQLYIFCPLVCKKIIKINCMDEISLENSHTVISIGFPRIFPASYLRRNKTVRFINLHGGVLPYQRGLFSPYWAVHFEDKYIGATLHKIDIGVDSGEIISSLDQLRDTENIFRCYKNVLNISKIILEDFVFYGKTYSIKSKNNDYHSRGVMGYPL